MKKRAQKPDNVTYTILLRGLANNAHLNGSLAGALSLYHGMTGPNSKIQPNITHINAVIKVCARCNDTESMWDIVSKLPERGPKSADSWTFCTIFNHMRYQAVTMRKPHNEAEADKRQMTLIKARQIWSVMVARWRQGELKLDEDVVAALGRVLLVGLRVRDWDDVLSLITQTTDIPRLHPPLKETESSDPEHSMEEVDGTSSTSLSSLSWATELQTAGSEFTPVQNNHGSPRDPNAQVFQVEGRKAFYIRPGVQTIQLLMEACLKLQIRKAATLYWDLLTDIKGYSITPDLACVHSYLRILRYNRASSEAAAIMCDWLPTWQIRPIALTYRFALTTCIRDKFNPNVLDSASRILDSMHNQLQEPDFPTLDSYLELVMSKKDVKRTRTAIDRLQPTLVNLRSYLSFGPTGPGQRSKDALTPQTRSHGVELMQRVIGCYDQILQPGVEYETYTRKDYLERKKSMAAYVSRYKNQWKLNDTVKKPWGPDVQTISPSRRPGNMNDAIRSEEQEEMRSHSTTGSGIDQLEASMREQDGKEGRGRRRERPDRERLQLSKQRTAGAKKQFS